MKIVPFSFEHRKYAKNCSVEMNNYTVARTFNNMVWASKKKNRIDCDHVGPFISR